MITNTLAFIIDWYRVVSGIGGLVEQNTPFFTVKSIVTKLLRIDICMNIHEREQILLESITDLELREMLPLLNDLLVLKVLLYIVASCHYPILTYYTPVSTDTNYCRLGPLQPTNQGSTQAFI